MWETTAKKLDRRGFTLMEVLVVIAMLSALAMLAVPGTVDAWRDLQLSRLDGTARELYLTAQNDLVDAKAAGRLHQLSADAALQSGTHGGETARYLRSGQTGGFLPQTERLLDSTGGSFLLYLNPDNGEAAALYYTQADALDADAVEELLASLEDAPNRKAQNSAQARAGIGAYGGETLLHAAAAAVSDSSAEEPAVPSEASLINREDLYFKLTCPGLRKGFANAGAVSVRLIVSDQTTEHTPVVWTADGDGAVGATPAKCVRAAVDAGGNYTLYVLLDSLAKGCSFTELFPTLSPGDDISVTAELTYDGGAAPLFTATRTENSLFGRRYAAADGPHAAGEIELSCVRHLSNLRYLSWRAATAVQTADLDFTKAVRQLGMMPGNAENAPNWFTPIPLDDSARQSSLTLDGQDRTGVQHVLQNFRVRVAEYGNNDLKSAGLISLCSVPAVLQNLRLEDVQVIGVSQVGALCGKAAPRSGSVRITNCGAYQTAPGVGWVRGGAYASSNTDKPTGGLIGAMNVDSGSVSLLRCFAALDVDNAKQVTGGLIGTVDLSGSGSVDIRSCYTAGTVQSGAENALQPYAGGLVGTIKDSSQTGAVQLGGCYSACNVRASDAAGALVGQASRTNTGLLWMTSCCGYGKVTTGTEVSYGPLVGGGALDDGTTYSDCAYLSQQGDASAEDYYGDGSGLTPVQGLCAKSYDDLTLDNVAAPVVNDPTACHPWAGKLQGLAFPFQMVTAEHWGDWPTRVESPPETPKEGEGAA